MRIAGILLVGLLALAAVPAAPADRAGAAPVLDHIVLVERHGVRSPTKGPDELARYAAQRWPDWPVAPGVLTDHGRRDVALMGAWLRADYARRGLWPAKGCLKAGSTYVWADGKDQRTRVSGQALLDGAFPGCGLTDQHGPDDETDGLFSATAAGLCPIDAEAARKAVLVQAGGDLNRLGAGYDNAKGTLGRILDPKNHPCTDEMGACFLAGRNALAAGSADGVKLTGPLADAGTVTENLFLEYVQGMPAGDVGWGRAGSPAALAAILPLHDLSADLTRRTPYLAVHNGSLIMRAVLAALDGKPALPRQGAAGAKLVAIAGHDTNLSNLAGILGVDWTLKDQPDKTPPDAALVFEVWKTPMGERFVRVALVYQTLDQLRRETPLDPAHPPGRMDLPIPGCADGSGGGCSLAMFTRLIDARLPGECRMPHDVATGNPPLDPWLPRA